MKVFRILVFAFCLVARVSWAEPTVSPAPPVTAVESAPTLDSQKIADEISKGMQEKLERKHDEQQSQSRSFRLAIRSIVYTLVAVAALVLVWLKKRQRSFRK